jgi:hypothetical protein
MLRPAADDNVDLAAAARGLHDVFARVFRGAGLATADADLAAGSTRSAIHGFVTLEHASGTSLEHDRYEHLLQALHCGLERR